MTPPVVVAFVAFAVVLVAVVVLPRFEVHSPVVGLLRVLLPSWRFFDTVSEPPLLSARVRRADGSFGPWTDVLPPPQRSWWNVAWHPGGNVSFACHSLLFRLRQDLAWCGPDDAPEDLVTYRLVLDLVRWRLGAGAGPGAGDAGDAGDAAGATGLQFRLVEPSAARGAADGPANGADEADEAAEPLLVSAVHAP